jgi:hypothetical protein
MKEDECNEEKNKRSCVWNYEGKGKCEKWRKQEVLDFELNEESEEAVVTAMA